MARTDFPIYEFNHYQRPGWSLILKGNHLDYYPILPAYGPERRLILSSKLKVLSSGMISRCFPAPRTAGRQGSKNLADYTTLSVRRSVSGCVTPSLSAV